MSKRWLFARKSFVGRFFGDESGVRRGRTTESRLLQTRSGRIFRRVFIFVRVHISSTRSEESLKRGRGIRLNEWWAVIELSRKELSIRLMEGLNRLHTACDVRSRVHGLSAFSHGTQEKVNLMRLNYINTRHSYRFSKLVEWKRRL